MGTISGHKQGTPWTNGQFTIGLTQRQTTMDNLVSPIHLLDCGENLSARRKPTPTQRENTNSTQKGL